MFTQLNLWLTIVSVRLTVWFKSYYQEQAMTGLDKAIQQIGSQRKLAIALGITPQSLNRWVKKYKGMVPNDHLLKIYELTGVTPNEIRPDIHPNPTSGLPQQQNKQSA
jgi:DNA-binding transcriptional regulator YdaS (Cro superfamily)